MKRGEECDSTVKLAVSAGARRRASRPVVAADKASVRQDVERIAGRQLVTADDARETLDVVDDVSRCPTNQVTWRDDATAAGTLDAVPSMEYTYTAAELHKQPRK